MSGTLEVLVWVSSSIIALYIGGKCLLYFSARAALRREFREPNCEITQIESFDGFLDLGSIGKTMTSTGYYVHVQSKNEAVKVFCLVRYVPVIGFAWAVERWTNSEMSPKK
jgi:hypothetical protein